MYPQPVSVSQVPAAGAEKLLSAGTGTGCGLGPWAAHALQSSGFSPRFWPEPAASGRRGTPPAVFGWRLWGQVTRADGLEAERDVWVWNWISAARAERARPGPRRVLLVRDLLSCGLHTYLCIKKSAWLPAAAGNPGVPREVVDEKKQSFYSHRTLQRVKKANMRAGVYVQFDTAINSTQDRFATSASPPPVFRSWGAQYSLTRTVSPFVAGGGEQ